MLRDLIHEMELRKGTINISKIVGITQTDHGLIVKARYDPELGLLVDEPDLRDNLV